MLAATFRNDCQRLGIEAVGTAPDSRYEFVCAGATIVVEPWTYEATSSEGSRSVFPGAHLRVEERQRRGNAAIIRRDADHPCPPGAVEIGVPSHWGGYRGYATDTSALFGWLSRSASFTQVGLGRIRIVQSSGGWLSLLIDGKIVAAADLVRLGHVMVSYLDAGPLDSEHKQALAENEGLAPPFVVLGLCLAAVVPLSISLAQLGGHYVAFAAVLCESHQTTAGQSSSMDFTSCCIDASGVVQTTSDIRQAAYVGAHVSVSVSLTLIAFLVVWRRKYLVNHLPRRSAQARAAAGPYR